MRCKKINITANPLDNSQINPQQKEFDKSQMQVILFLFSADAAKRFEVHA
ncbi:MAG: hypothetical protein JWN76_3737 [Chitinophagaceae bacterium]|nr:hypothetical protein [Chitinophagaceae bacterium]